MSSNYINELSLQGMMNKFCTQIDDKSYWKDKKHTKLIVCRDMNYDIPENVKEISYMYLNEKPNNVKGVSYMYQIESIIDDTFLPNNIKRTNHKEIYETYHKYRNKVEVINEPGLISKYYNKIIEMIEQWRYTLGMKYHWQERAGVDKAFFERYINNIDEYSTLYTVNLFFYKVNDMCKVLVGYSIMPDNYEKNEDNINEVSYMLRKCITNFVYEDKEYNLRNITEYIDWYTFTDYMSRNQLNKLIINWGCSTGGVAWYKEHKWPLYKKEQKWFVKIKSEK